MVEGIYRLFDSIWRLSLVGSYCILLVILARFLLKKAPKWCSYLLWGIVFVRLCCPVLPGTRISLIPERLLTVGTATTSAQLTAGNSAGSVDNEGVYNGIQYLGYDGVAARKLHQRILDGDAAAHETYKDPVKAAEVLLNLQGGSGEMTELLYEAGRQYLFFQKDSTRPGEGSVANVHYIFADGSGIDIPMVFAEESSQIWMLSLGDIDSKGRHSTGPLA